jgi:hypothetical protein
MAVIPSTEINLELVKGRSYMTYQQHLLTPYFKELD